MNKYLLVASISCLINLTAMGKVTTSITPDIDPNKIATTIQAKAPEIKSELLKNLQNTPSHTLQVIAHEPAQSALTIFPIETPLMTPDKIEPKKIDLPTLPQPLFLIGSDELSKQWLISHMEQLKKIRAVGFLVQAKNQADFESIKTLAAGLVIIPLCGNILSQQWSIYHYPVLISQHTVEQ